MPIGYLSLWGQPRSVTSGDLRWPWNSCGAKSRVTASHVLIPITSTIPIQVNRPTPSCVYTRFRWNIAEGCSLCDVITSWPDLTWPNFFTSYGKFQRDTPNGLASSSEKLMGGCINPPPPLPPLARVKPDFWVPNGRVLFTEMCCLSCRTYLWLLPSAGHSLYRLSMVT